MPDERHRTEDDHRRHDVEAIDEDRAEQDRDRGTGRARVRGVEVEEECREPERRAEHDAGRDVPSPRSSEADHLDRPSDDHRRGDEPGERADADQVGAEPPAVPTSLIAWP